jgi:DnaJ-class molecular chaperone
MSVDQLMVHADPVVCRLYNMLSTIDDLFKREFACVECKGSGESDCWQVEPNPCPCCWGRGWVIE